MPFSICQVLHEQQHVPSRYLTELAHENGLGKCEQCCAGWRDFDGLSTDLLGLALQLLAGIFCGGVGLVAQILRFVLCLLGDVLCHRLSLVSDLLRLALYVVGHLLCMLRCLCMSHRVLSMTLLSHDTD